jgi:hypothetical protein
VGPDSREERRQGAQAVRTAPYLPSAMGLGLSWVMVFSNSQALALRAVINWLWVARS